MVKLFVVIALFWTACSSKPPVSRPVAVSSVPVEVTPDVEDMGVEAPDVGAPLPVDRCAASCELRGECTPTERGCVVSTEADCLASTVCRDEGYCRLVDGRCRIDCDKAPTQTLQVMARQGEVCFKDVSVTCEETRGCAEAGFCAAQDDGSCGWNPDCTQPCRAEGACKTWEWSGCGVVSDKDCERSKACKDEKRCAVLGNSCATRAEADAQCEAPQISVDGSCHYPRGYDCAKECRDHNRCEAFVSRTRRDAGQASRAFVECVQTDAFCAAQPDCAERGICGAIKERWYEYNKCFEEPCGEPHWGGCKKTPSGCEASKRCKLDGSCSAGSYSMYCRPTEPAHCEQSIACKQLGDCGLVRVSGYSECGATEEAHCQQSDDCKKNGVCAFVRGDCVRP